MKNCTLLVSSCDAYSDLWDPFFELLKIHWPDIDLPIILITDGKKYSKDGLDIQCPLNQKEKRRTWSECVIEALKYVKTDYVLFMLDDFWINEPVNELLVYKCLHYFDNNEKIGNFCVRHQPDYIFNKDSIFDEFYVRASSEPYRLTTQVTVWRKTYLQKILRKHESAWDFETYAKYRSRYLYSEEVYLIKPTIKMPISYHSGGVLFRGKYVKPYVEEFNNNALSIDLSRGYYEEKPTNYEKIKKPNYSVFKIIKSLLPKF